jgi:cyclopropane fatty-acyl-phospholipid synthase-like methyltransferase
MIEDNSTNISHYHSHSYDKPGGNEYQTKGFENLIAKHQAKIEYLKGFNLGSDSKILDIGCGFGSFGYCLFNQVLDSQGRYQGVDVSKERIKQARRLMIQTGINGQFDVINNMNDCLKYKGVNWVTFFSVFTHIFNEDIVNYLLISNQVLEQRGRLGFSILDIESQEGLFYLNEMSRRNSRKRFKTEFYTIHSLDYIKTLLRYTGFQMIDSSFLPPNIQRFCIAEKIQEKSQLGK